ncbi:SLAIN motif-containing protein-like [Labrus mixtus]|uniref:SLAIN motif-containing protein-like n=1 Tax=Labrus mixtus TaxID=508554 RepID=UPI0029C0B831|nr:SLAIN motif-containing protein-like [Labrus mixtus]
MELHQGLMESDWSQHFSNQPPVECDTSSDLHLLFSELKSSSGRQDGNSDPYSRIWTLTEQPRITSCNNHSYSMDARLRLNNLKAGCNSLLPFPAVDGILYNYNCQKDLWKKEDPEEEESALDLVELLDVEEDVNDEESWLYESPKKPVFEEKTESALTWCRQVLDNPSPEVEAACRQLINRLDERSGSHSYRRPAVLPHTGDVTVGTSLDKTPVSSTTNPSDVLDINELSISNDFTTTRYRLRNITDVRTMARLQEASLRQDFVSTPATALRRSPESTVMSPSYSNTTFENSDDFTPGSQAEASSSSCWLPGLLSLSSSPCQSPASGGKQGCQSPKLARLQQQVTQFKLLKLAQNQATSTGRTRQTSLRSLQAVRNNRSLDTDGCGPADQDSHPTSGPPPAITGSGFWSPSRSGAQKNSSGSVHSGVDVSARMKKQQRSQSASPCRIPHSAMGYLSFSGRVFASPERSASLAWGRNVPSTRR